MTAAHEVSYVGQLQTIRWGSKGANATIVQVEHLAPDLTRRWFVAPESLYGDYVVVRGSESYHFDVHNDRVVTSRNPLLNAEGPPADVLNLLNANYRAVLGGTEEIAGRPVVAVSLINKYTGEKIVRVFIDTETKLVLEKESYRSNGALAYQMRYENVRYTNDIPSGIFATTVPKGYRLINGPDFAAPSTDLAAVIKEAGFSPVNPRYLPDGFAVVSGDTTVINGVRTLHLLYSDGIRTLSLFENAANSTPAFGSLKSRTVEFEHHSAELAEDGPVSILTWKERDLSFALVSDLGQREMIAIATSVVP